MSAADHEEGGKHECGVHCEKCINQKVYTKDKKIYVMSRKKVFRKKCSDSQEKYCFKKFSTYMHGKK